MEKIESRKNLKIQIEIMKRSEIDDLIWDSREIENIKLSREVRAETLKYLDIRSRELGRSKSLIDRSIDEAWNREVNKIREEVMSEGWTSTDVELGVELMLAEKYRTSSDPVVIDYQPNRERRRNGLEGKSKHKRRAEFETMMKKKE
jgi:hypothetical protein